MSGSGPGEESRFCWLNCSYVIRWPLRGDEAKTHMVRWERWSMTSCSAVSSPLPIRAEWSVFCGKQNFTHQIRWSTLSQTSFIIIWTLFSSFVYALCFPLTISPQKSVSTSLFTSLLWTFMNKHNFFMYFNKNGPLTSSYPMISLCICKCEKHLSFKLELHDLILM